MGDASSAILRRSQRVLYAHRVIKLAAFDNGLIGYIGLEGKGRTAMSYSSQFYDIKDGTFKTTLQEQQSYIDSVAVTSDDGLGRLTTKIFSTPTTTTWTAPANVTYVQYLCVGGGGGGGAAYSKIIDLGAVPVLYPPTDTVPQSSYWIYGGISKTAFTNGRMYYGPNRNLTGGPSTFTDPIRCTVSAELQPTDTSSPAEKWYAFEAVYNLSGYLPIVTNVGFPSNSVSSTFNNNISGGGGGGAGGQVNGNFSASSFYSVTPGTQYTVIVGDGGEGGIGGPNSETAGTKGGDSRFDIIVSEGGSGGQPSRVSSSNTGGYNNGGRGQTSITNLIGGYGGDGVGGSGGQGLATTGGDEGAGGGVGPIFSGTYSSGGSGGVPNTVASGVTTPNIGKGGAGTGATLNSYASGVKGGTGVVIIKYYV